MANKTKYHIIGAGISGLFTAKLLKEKYPDAYIIIYEAAEKIGGRCQSSFNNKLGCQTDNATHVVLSCNKLAKSLIGKENVKYPICFYNLMLRRFISTWRCLKEAELAVFNSSKVSIAQKIYLYSKLFPFIGLRAYFSEGDLEERLCQPLLSFCDEIHYGWVWKKIHSANTKIQQLVFNKGTINISPEDTIISAVDSYNYNKIIGGYEFNYNTIGNVFYRTSMALEFPNNRRMIGIYQGKSQWIFSSSQCCAVTASCIDSELNPFAVWQEICRLKQYNSAFLPAYQVRNFKRATICQDHINNAKRPISARTKFKNLFICGDWTMKNQPCCIETALQSAVRVMKTI